MAARSADQMVASRVDCLVGNWAVLRVVQRAARLVVWWAGRKAEWSVVNWAAKRAVLRAAQKADSTAEMRAVNRVE